MKIKPISDHITVVRSWLIVPVQVWIICEEDGLTLVDTGASFMSGGILKQLNRLHRNGLKKILLTHGHADHVGSVRAICRQYNVPVYAHEQEIPYMEGRMPYPGRSKIEKLLEPGTARPLPAKQEAAEKLERIGSLEPYHTPGHSPGHVVYYHRQDDVLLAGDLFRTKKGRLHGPIRMFTADMSMAVQSGSIVEELQPRLLSVCHGSELLHSHRQYSEYVRTFA
jgi:glyoxylase-like metal-dependent hydrolase (beta-lactamase superfamily II)